MLRYAGKYYRFNGHKTKNRCPESGGHVFGRTMLTLTCNIALIINYRFLEMKIKTADRMELSI